MSRENVTSVSARAETGKTPAWTVVDRRLRAAFGGLAGSWVQRAVPFMLALFIAALAAVSTMMSLAEQDCVIEAAKAEVDLLASVIARDVNLQDQDAGQSLRAALGQAVPRHALRHGSRILVTNGDGEVVASYPEEGVTGALTDKLGQAQPLTTLAEKAGAQQITLPDHRHCSFAQPRARPGCDHRATGRCAVRLADDAVPQHYARLLHRRRPVRTGLGLPLAGIAHPDGAFPL
jgi:two-component system, cell cycle sensor histidine kinase PleC